MEFAIAKQVLADELGKLQSVVPDKPVIAALGLIKVESTEDGGIKLTASNMESTIYSTVVSKLLAVSEPGAMCLPAKRLIDIVRLMQDGPIKISSDANDWIKIIAKGSSQRLPGTPASAYPDLPTFENLQWVDIPASHLKNMLPAVKYAITADEKRMNIRGAKLEVDSENSQVRVITTDGHRLSLSSGPLEGLVPQDFEVLIPIETIEELIKLLGDQSEGLVGVATNVNSLFFRVGNRILSTRLIAGKFPSYQKPFAELGTYEHFANFKADELTRRIRMALLFSQESSDKEKKAHAGVSLEFDQKYIQIKAQSPDLGETNEVLDSDYNGPPLTIFCNGKYLLDFLKPVGSGTVKFEVKSALNQMYLTGERDGIMFYYCLMPMRG